MGSSGKLDERAEIAITEAIDDSTNHAALIFQFQIDLVQMFLKVVDDVLFVRHCCS